MSCRGSEPDARTSRRPRPSGPNIAHSLKGAKADAVHGPTIAECAEKYLASRRHELGDKTLGQHKLVLDRLNKFCESNNVIYMRDLSVDLLETFKTARLPGDMADTSKATAVAKLRCFLRTAYRRDWIKESLREKVTSYRAVYEQKEPVQCSSDEMLKLVSAQAGIP